MISHLTLLLTLGSGGNAMPEPGEIVPDRDPGQVVRDVYRSPHGELAYRLYLPPADGRPTGPAPLIVMLHGCTQDADDFARGTRMGAHARDRGAAVLYPEQPASAHPNLCWNWYEPDHQRRDDGEPAILAGMIRQIVAERGLDPARIYVAGISAGGAMAAILAVTYPDLVTAAASHSGVPYGAARGLGEALEVLQEGNRDEASLRRLGEAASDAMGERRRPLPLLVLHGDGDDVVSSANADGFLIQWKGLLARALGAPPAVEEVRPAADEGHASLVQVIRDEAGRVLFERRDLRDLGHAWSGGSEEGTFTWPPGVDASRLVLDFFLGDPKGDPGTHHRLIR